MLAERCSRRQRASPRTRVMALKPASAPQNNGIGEMSVHQMKFVVVNDMAPRKTSVCARCSRPLEQGYLRDISTSRRYCGVACYPQWMVVSGFVEMFSPTN